MFHCLSWGNVKGKQTASVGKRKWDFYIFSSFIISCTISNRVRHLNKVWSSLKGRYLSYQSALNSQRKQEKRESEWETFTNYLMKHYGFSFSWLFFFKKTKNLMLDKTGSKHRLHPGPMYFEKSLLCSDFV